MMETIVYLYILSTTFAAKVAELMIATLNLLTISQRQVLYQSHW